MFNLSTPAKNALQIASLCSTAYLAVYLARNILGAVSPQMIELACLPRNSSNTLFAIFSGEQTASAVVYGITGFSLAMIYAPMTKLVSENTDPKYTHRCSLGYTFASFFGSPLAGLAAAVIAWQGVFTVGSVLLILMGIKEIFTKKAKSVAKTQEKCYTKKE